MNENWGQPEQRWADFNHLWQDPANTVDSTSRPHNQDAAPEAGPTEASSAPAAKPEPQREPQSDLPQSEPAKNSSAHVWVTPSPESQSLPPAAIGMAGANGDFGRSNDEENAAAAGGPEPDRHLADSEEHESGGYAPLTPSATGAPASESNRHGQYSQNTAESTDSLDSDPEPDASVPETQEECDRTEVLPLAGLDQAPRGTEADHTPQNTAAQEDVPTDTFSFHKPQADFEPPKPDELPSIPEAGTRAAQNPEADFAPPAGQYSPRSADPDTPETHSTVASQQPTMSDGFRGPLLPNEAEAPKPPNSFRTPAPTTERQSPPVWDYDQPPSTLADYQPEQSPRPKAGGQESSAQPPHQTPADPAESDTPTPNANHPSPQATDSHQPPEGTGLHGYRPDREAPADWGQASLSAQQSPPGSYPPSPGGSQPPAAQPTPPGPPRPGPTQTDDGYPHAGDQSVHFSYATPQPQKPTDSYQTPPVPGPHQSPTGSYPAPTNAYRTPDDHQAPPGPVPYGPKPAGDRHQVPTLPARQQPSGYPPSQAADGHQTPDDRWTHFDPARPQPQRPTDSYQTPPIPGPHQPPIGSYPPPSNAQQTPPGAPNYGQTRSGSGHQTQAPSTKHRPGDYPPPSSNYAPPASSAPASDRQAFQQSGGGYPATSTPAPPRASSGRQEPTTPHGYRVPTASFGQPQTAGHESAPADRLGHAQNYSQPTEVNVGNEPPFASFGKRVVGWLFDYLLPWLVLGVISAIPPALLDNSPSATTFSTVLLWVLPLVWFFVLSLISGKTGATPGRKIAKTKLVDARTGQPIGVGKTFLRYICHFIDNVICLVGWLFPLWDNNRQTLADKILTTYVIETG